MQKFLIHKKIKNIIKNNIYFYVSKSSSFSVFCFSSYYYFFITIITNHKLFLRHTIVENPLLIDIFSMFLSLRHVFWLHKAILCFALNTFSTFKLFFSKINFECFKNFSTFTVPHSSYHVKLYIPCSSTSHSFTSSNLNLHKNISSTF